MDQSTIQQISALAVAATKDKEEAVEVLMALTGRISIY